MISLGVLAGLLIMGGTVWWLRARSVSQLAQLEVVSPVAIVPSNPSSSSSTQFAASSSAPLPPVTIPYFSPDRTFPRFVSSSVGSPPSVPKPPSVNEEGGVTDTDGDGLTNDQENQAGTNPAVQDTDGDTLSDGDEVKKYRTDPLKADSDGDGYTDAQEIKNGYNPLGTGKCLTSDCAF